MKRGPPSADERDPKRQNTTPTLTVEREYKEVRTNYWPLELYTNKTIFKYHYEFAVSKKFLFFSNPHHHLFSLYNYQLNLFVVYISKIFLYFD
jgi:hypothetical protein